MNFSVHPITKPQACFPSFALSSSFPFFLFLILFPVFFLSFLSNPPSSLICPPSLPSSLLPFLLSPACLLFSFPFPYFYEEFDVIIKINTQKRIVERIIEQIAIQVLNKVRALTMVAYGRQFIRMQIWHQLISPSHSLPFFLMLQCSLDFLRSFTVFVFS